MDILVGNQSIFKKSIFKINFILEDS